MILKILLLACLVKVLIESESPGLCTFIYALVAVPFMFFTELPWYLIITFIPLQIGLAYLYFYLLLRFEGSVWFWLILVGGLAIGMI